MSLPHALLTSLAERPGSGSELAGRFDRSIGYFWQATHQQIYRELARLDVELSAVYRKAREAATDAKALQNEQLQWLKATRKACSDKACLAEAYKSRTAELSR